MIKQIQHILLRLSLIFLGVLVALASVEFGVRWLDPPFEQRSYEMHVCDRQVGWKGKANLITPVNIDGYQHDVVRNSQGMHDTEHQLESEDNVFRILMLGDSFVEAIQVDRSEISPRRLENILNNSPNSTMRFEVISAGIGAWGPAQELAYFNSAGQQYQPDLILSLWVPANDLLDILPDYRLTYDGINCYAPYFVICGDQFDPEPWFSVPGIRPIWKICPGHSQKLLMDMLNRLYYRSRLYQRLEPILTQQDHRIEYAHPYAPWLPSKQTDEVLQHSYQITTEIYTHLAAEADKIGARTALVIVPAKQAVYIEADPGSVDLAQLNLDGLRANLPNQVFTKLMHARGLPVLDLQPYFVRKVQQENERLYWESDSHWNVQGNELAAEVIAAWLIQEKLIPTSF
jgi:hypothetical protein